MGDFLIIPSLNCIKITQKQAWRSLIYFSWMKSMYFREYVCRFSRKLHYFCILGVSHLKAELFASHHGPCGAFIGQNITTMCFCDMPDMHFTVEDLAMPHDPRSVLAPSSVFLNPHHGQGHTAATSLQCLQIDVASPPCHQESFVMPLE